MPTHRTYTRELKDNAMRGFSYIGLVVIPFVSYLSFSMKDTLFGIFQLVFWGILVVNLAFISRARSAKLPALVILLPLFALLQYIVINGTYYFMYWIFILPPISFFLLNLNTGLFLNILFIFLFGGLLGYKTNYFSDQPQDAITIITTYLTISSVAYFMERYRRKIVERLRVSSHTDFLTGIGNRRHFQLNLKRQISVAQSQKRPFSLMILDADHFKEVNDTYGHPAGDKILIDLVTLIKTILRSEDGFFRVGGEEFAVIFPETSIDEAQVIAEKVRSEVAGHIFEHNITITISIGLAEYVDGAQQEDLFQAADRALYQAKKSGRNRVELFVSKK
ncbi:MAG: GGDEF domain-containing protein [Leptospirales bacterium]